jgi:hypothetical protein
VALDQACDEAGGLGLLDEVVEEAGAGRVRLGGADRLLHGSEAALENAGSGQLLDVLQKARPEAGERVQLIGDELLERGIEAARANDLGVPKVAAQPEVVGAAGRILIRTPGRSTSAMDPIGEPAATSQVASIRA